MPHQCVHCGKLYPDASKELLIGCTCGSRFFYFIKKEYYDRLNRELNKKKDLVKVEEIEEEEEKLIGKAVEEIKTKIEELNKYDKEKIEKDVREIIGITEREDIPIILDLESIRVLKPGKFEIDVVNLFNKKRPLIYKLEEGKYIIDLASTLRLNSEELEKKIRNPEFKKKKKR